MSATIKDIADFFKTGDPERDKLGTFREEWLELSENDREWFKDEVGKILGK